MQEEAEQKTEKLTEARFGYTAPTPESVNRTIICARWLLAKHNDSGKKFEG